MDLTNGDVTVDIDGDKFTVSLSLSLFNPPSSKVSVTRGNSKVVNTTLIKLSEKAALKGMDLKLGAAYKLAYGNELVQGKGGAVFTDARQVFLMPFPIDENMSNHILNTSDMPSPGAVYRDLEPGFGFRVTDGVLEIFQLK
jgi:hypothetical protein